MMYKYPKIETIFERDNEGSKKLIEGKFRDKTVEFLQDAAWYATEKIDGTNIGVYWDGHEVHFQGRTEKADIPKPLLTELEAQFGGETNAQMFEQMFGEKEVVLFGEGYGGKIQKVGSKYRDRPDFILFDVYFPGNDIWLERVNVEEIARSLGIMVVPIVPNVCVAGSLWDFVRYVKSGPMSIVADETLPMEGVVCRPVKELKDRLGNRIIVKIKRRDFKEEE